MSILYEFQGHDLRDWAEFGGLPVWLGDYGSKIGGRLICINENSFFRYVCCTNKGKDLSEWDLVHIHYSDINDVIDQKPDGAEWFTVQDHNTCYFTKEKPSCWRGSYGFPCTPPIMCIKGHLFNRDDYPEPVMLE